MRPDETLLCKQANQIDLVDYLENLGHSPQKIRENDYWYLSPLREEKTASFKVNRKLNLWYDHGTVCIPVMIPPPTGHGNPPLLRDQKVKELSCN